jgi:hypothetical protein
MSRLNYLVREPISFVGGPWRSTANLVRWRVFTMLRPPHAQCGGINTEKSLTNHP